jgi:tetratricopeptide (TPR) repeat protein
MDIGFQGKNISGLSAFLPFFLLAAAVLVIYAGGLRNGFVYDDQVQLVENVALRSLRNIPLLFIDPAHTSSSGVVEEIYRPLRGTLFAIEYHLWGLNPTGFHAVNVLFHALNSFLVFLFLKRFVPGAMPAFGAALLFAVHPALTENVSWVCSRSDLLCMFFFIIGLLCYITSCRNRDPQKNRWALYSLSLLSLMFALLSKEMAVMFPAAMIAIDLWGDGLKNLRARWREYAPFLVLTFAYLVFRMNIMSQFAQTDPLGKTPIQTAGIMARGTLYYIRLVLLPVDLNVLPYIDTGIPLGDIRTLGALCLTALLISSACVLRRRYPTASLGAFLFFVLLLPVSNIVPIKAVVAERFIYIPSLGFSVVCAAWLRVAESFNHSRMIKALTAAAISVVVFVYSTLTIARNMDWRSNLTLFISAVEKAPENPRAHVLLAKEYFVSGHYDDSLRECLTALKLNPGLAEAHTVLGSIYLRQGILKPAEDEFRIALSLDPHNAEISNGLGIVYRQQGRLDEALAAFKAALKRSPMVSEILNNVGSVLLEKGEVAAAAEYFNKALNVRPDNWEAACNMAYSLVELGRPGDAVGLIEQWLSRQPADVEMLNLLGRAHSASGNYGAASEAYTRAIRANPSDARAYTWLADLYMSHGEYENAVQVYRSILAMYPASVNHRVSLAEALERSGLHEEALEELRAAARLSPDRAVEYKTRVQSK